VEWSASQQSVSIFENAFHILEAPQRSLEGQWNSSCFRYRDVRHSARRANHRFRNLGRCMSEQSLSATGERRQNFNLYGLGQLLLKIFPMGCASVDQYRAHLDDPVEAGIRSPLTGEPEGVGNRLSLKCFLGDACCGPCASPVMKGNGHHCVTLKHAFRPYRGGLKASTVLIPDP
jgi:hypothetical protein